MKKTIIITSLAIFFLGCNNKATDKINTDSSTKNKDISTETSENNSEDNISPELVFNDGTDGPKIEFDMEVWEFGEINEGESVDTIFTFKNVGNKPLIINNAKAGCGCTVPQWPKEPIAPGESGTIAVKFNSKGKPGKQTKRVTLTMNTTPNTKQLRLSGLVNPAAK